MLLIVQPMHYSRAGDIASTLAPHLISSEGKMIGDPFLGSIEDSESEMNLLSFAIRSYKTIVENKKSVKTLFEELKELPYWEGFWLREHLEKDFIEPQQYGILHIKLKNNGLIRVIDLEKNVCDIDRGVFEKDGLIPDHFYPCYGHLVQYFRDFSDPAEDKASSSEGQKLNVDDPPQAMINFNPALSYQALELNEDIRGIYITAEKQEDGGYKLVCMSEDEISSTAEEIMKFMNAALRLLEAVGIQDAEREDYTGFSAKSYRREWNRIKTDTGRRKIFIESAFDFSANSARYYPERYKECIVFDYGFLDFLNKVFLSSTNEDMFSKGEVIVLAERLFHEISHAEDELVQVKRDVRLYETMIRPYAERLDAVKRDVVHKTVGEGTSEADIFGNRYETNPYFKMLREISGLYETGTRTNDIVITEIIRNYIRENNQKISQKAAAFISAEDKAGIQKLLSLHGIKDDIFGEQVIGEDFKKFLSSHCLFSYFPPKINQYTRNDQQGYTRSIWKMRSISRIKDALISAACAHGTEEKMRQDLIGRNTKKSLYPLILWAAKVKYPQNYQRWEGRLFEEVHYEGLNLLLLSIFAVDDEWNIRWDLMGWMHEDAKPMHSDGAPSFEYYRSKKVSLYEYFIMNPDDLPEITPDDVEIPGRLVQLSLFDDPEFSRENPAVKKDIEAVHEAVSKVDHTQVVGKMTYIVIDDEILADSQSNIADLIERYSRDPLVSEKIVFIEHMDIDEYLAENKCDNTNTVVFVSGTEKINETPRFVNVLAVEREITTDFVNIEGLIGIARSLLNRNVASFREIYKLLTGEECEVDIDQNMMEDPEILAKMILIRLPRISVLDFDRQQEYNELLRKFITTKA